MPFEIELTEQAEDDLRTIKAFYRRSIISVMEQQLRYAPTQTSQSRIKRLRLLDSPAYRLRVDDYRVFYDVDAEEHLVTVLRILDKEAAQRYLEELLGYDDPHP